MGSKSSKAGTKTSNSDDIVIDSKKGVVNISGRNGHRYTNVRTFYTEYYSDGTKKLENVVDISSEYNSKIPRYLNDLDANQQSKYKVKVPLPDPTPYKTNNSQMKRTNGVVIHSDDNNLLDNNGMVIELEAGGKRQKREHHFTGLLTIADQHKALCKYECKQARDHLSTEVTVNSLDFTHQAGQNMCIRNASLSIETTERGCEQECETETIVPVGEPIVEQFHEEHAAILQSIQSSLSDVYACDKLAKVFQNYNDNDSSIETVEEILIHDADEDSGTLGRCSFYGQESIECRCIGTFSNTSSMDSSLTFRKVLVLGVDKLEFSRKANNSMIATEPGPILRFPVINEASRENIYIQRPETEWPRPIDMTVPESCQFEMPNIAKYEPDEQHHRLVNACNSSYPPDMKVLLNVILLFILVYYKHENTAEEEDAKRNDTLEHREVSFESDQGYGSIMSLRSEHLTQRCQGMPTTGPKDDGSSIPQLKLKNALKECIGFDFATCIASCDPIIAFPGLNGYFDRLRSGRAITERERMSYEWLRLMTFASYNGNGCPVHLARSGFYHTGLNEIRCFCCDTSYLDWEATDEVEQTHRRVSPACPFIVGGIDAAGNIAIDECVEESREEEEGHILLERQEISLRGSERRGQYPRHENAINRSSTDVSLEQRARNGYAINNGEGYGITYDGNLARDRNTGPNGNSAVSGRNSEPDSQTRNNRIDTTLGSNLPHGSITASDSRGNEYVARGRSRFADQDNIINRIQEISPASNDISGQTSMVEYITQDFTTNTTPSRPHSGFNSDDDVYGAAGYGIGSADTSRISGITNEGGSDETYLEEVCYDFNF